MAMSDDTRDERGATWHQRAVVFEQRADDANDGLTLNGYAAVFDEPTFIEDREGVYVERIAPGAFKRSLGQRMPVLQFDHGQHPVVGSMPLGVIRSIREDDHGLSVKAVLADNWMVAPVRDAIRSGAIDGMSFRFRVIREEWTQGQEGAPDERRILEVELAEVGPVVFPAYPQTSVSVRSQVGNDLLDRTAAAFRSHLTNDFDPSPALVEGTDEAEAPPPVGTPSEDAPAPAARPLTITRRQRDLAYTRDVMALLAEPKGH